jgi:hypothetical protein
LATASTMRGNIAIYRMLRCSIRKFIPESEVGLVDDILAPRGIAAN